MIEFPKFIADDEGNFLIFHPSRVTRCGSLETCSASWNCAKSVSKTGRGYE